MCRVIYLYLHNNVNTLCNKSNNSLLHLNIETVNTFWKHIWYVFIFQTYLDKYAHQFLQLCVYLPLGWWHIYRTVCFLDSIYPTVYKFPFFSRYIETNPPAVLFLTSSYPNNLQIHREKFWINLFWIIRHHVLSNACCAATVFRKDFKVGIFRRRCFPERDSEIAGLSDEREGR